MSKRTEARSLTIPIPGAAMKWAKDEAKSVKRLNPQLDYDDLAALLVLRGIIIAATAPELHDCLHNLHNES